MRFSPDPMAEYRPFLERFGWSVRREGNRSFGSWVLRDRDGRSLGARSECLQFKRMLDDLIGTETIRRDRIEAAEKTGVYQ